MRRTPSERSITERNDGSTSDHLLAVNKSLQAFGGDLPLAHIISLDPGSVPISLQSPEMRATIPAVDGARCVSSVASRVTLPDHDFEAPAWRRSSLWVSSQTGRVLLSATVLLSALLPACPAIVWSGEPPVTRGLQVGKFLSLCSPGNCGGSWGRGGRGVAGHSRGGAGSLRGLRGGGFWIWGNKDANRTGEENLTQVDDGTEPARNASTAHGIREESQILSQMLADAIVMGASPGPFPPPAFVRNRNEPGVTRKGCVLVRIALLLTATQAR